MLIDGRGSIDTPDGSHALLPGACLILRGGEPYTFHHDEAHPFLHFYVHFDWLDGEGVPILPTKAPAPSLMRLLPEPSLLELLLQRLVEEHRRGAAERAAAYLGLAMLEIDRADRQISEGVREHGISATIADICRRIDAAPGDRWVVGDLAHEAGMSRSNFFRRFREASGRSPQAYIVDARMRMARFLLRDSGNPVSMIAGYLGYSEIYYFSRQFKEYHGMSPTRYRSGKSDVPIRG